MDNLEIRFHELPHSKPIRRFIDGKLGDWMARHNFRGARDEAAKVEFFRSAMDQKVGCYIEIKKGESVWRNFEYGKGIQDTFQICLKHLSENLRIKPQLQTNLVMKGA